MRGCFLVFALVLAACASSEDPRDARTRQCAQVRDHLIDLRLAHAHDVDAHRAAMKQALGDRFVDECAASLTQTQITCALTASDAVAAIDCTRSGNTSTN